MTRPRLRKLAALWAVTRALLPVVRSVVKAVVTAYRQALNPPHTPPPDPVDPAREARRERVRRYRELTASEMIEFWMLPSSLRAAIHGVEIIARTSHLPAEEVWNMARIPWKLESRFPVVALFEYPTLKRMR